VSCRKHKEYKGDLYLKFVRLIYFSPTGTTRRIVEAIAQGVGGETVDHLDLTRAGTRRPHRFDSGSDISIIGVPVYTGRVAFQAVKALQRMEASGTPAIIVVVYGNRAYEDALAELRDIAGRVGFVPIAGATFVGEHSFSTAATPIANGRPDSEDLEKAVAFGKMVRERLDAVEALRDLPPLKVPGNLPYRERAQPAALPETAIDLCTRCKACESACPEGAITVTDRGVATDVGGCILCCACVKNCPTGARSMGDPILKEIAERLSATCIERKAPEFFMIRGQ